MIRMKVRASTKPICDNCYTVVRKRKRYNVCSTKAKHKQRQG